MTTKARTTCRRICARADPDAVCDPGSGRPADARHLARHFPVRASRATARAPDRAAPDRRMSARVGPRPGWQEHAPDLPLIEVGRALRPSSTAAKALGVEPGRIAKTLAVRAGDAASSCCVARGDARLDKRKSQGRVRRPAADARGRGDARADRPSGGRSLPVRARDAPARLSRRVAASVRRRLSRLADRSTPRSKYRPSACSTWSAERGSTYAGSRGSGGT